MFARRLPTDLQILNAIYNRYYRTFTAYSQQNQNRRTKNLVPIDIAQISRDMGVDGDIIFGRLYYHLDKKYRYRQEDSPSYVSFFTNDGEMPHCVNFPYLASVLAGLRDENKKYQLSIRLSIFSLVISISAFLITQAPAVMKLLHQRF
jgi:hypothetical protein